MTISPLNKEEQFIFAVEDLRAEIQYDILRCLKEAGISQAELAKRIGVSAPWVSQILGDDANLTVESIVKVFLGFDRQCKIISAPLHEELSCVEPMARGVNSTKSAGWTEVKWNEADRITQSYASSRDTVGTLMKIIEGNCRTKNDVVRANDNSYVQDNERARELA